MQKLSADCVGFPVQTENIISENIGGMKWAIAKQLLFLIRGWLDI